MAHDASNNNPVKEIIHSLLGISLLLVIISGIAVSAWLRPAGNHEPASEPATKAGKELAEKISAIENPAPAENKADTAATTDSADGQSTDTAGDTATASATDDKDKSVDKAQESTKADSAEAKTETADAKPAN